MRKKILSLAMLPLLIISILGVLNVNIVEVSAQVTPRITFAPETLVNETLTPGTVFYWPISTDYNGSDIWGYEFTITYNPVVLNVLDVSNGDLIVNGTGVTSARFQPGTINNDVGKLSVTSAYFYFISPPANVTDGPGTLATVEFNVTDIGDSDITFGVETKLMGWNATAVEEYNIIDDITPASGHILNGYFANTNPIHNVKVNSVSANETSVLSGELVNVTVVAENEGNVTEKFDVTAYYSTLPIETQTITLDSSDSQTLYFIWDTTPARGNVSISAEASDVGSTYDPETSSTDNTLTDDTVTVRPPILAVAPNEIINSSMTSGSFDINITITNAYDLSMAVFKLTWDAATLTATSIVNGSFLEGDSTVFDIISNGMGYAVINYSRTGGAPGVTGNGTLTTVTFNIKKSGGTWIELKPYPTWWTTCWKTTPVVDSGVFANYFDMSIEPAGSSLDRSWVYPTWTTPVKVTLTPMNNGFLYLTYNMSIYANGTLITTEIQTLVGTEYFPDNKRTYTYRMYFTGHGWGIYPIEANITDVDPEDNNPGNNYHAFVKQVTVRIPGDIDGDGDVDFDDFITFAGKYGTKTVDSTSEACDIDGDGDVDFDDFIIFAGKYGTSTNKYP